jgi:hypothetical protein
MEIAMIRLLSGLSQIAVVSAAVVFPLLACAATAVRGKPQPPVQVTIAPSQPSQANAAIKPGDSVPIRIAVTPAADATQLHIVCTLSEGVELVSGALEWTGPAKKGEEQVHALTVRSPRNGKGMVSARVELYADGVLLFTTNAEYDLETAAMEKPQQPIGTRKDSKGRRVDEYR